MKKKDNDKTIRWLSSVIGNCKLYVLLLLVIKALQGSLSILDAIILKNVVNSAVASNKQGFISSFSLLCVLLIGQMLLILASHYLNEYTISETTNRLEGGLFQNLLIRDYGSVTQIHSGEWMNRLTSDTTIVAEGVANIVPGLAGMLVRLCGALLAILWLEPRFLLVLIPGGIILLVLTYFLRKIMKNLHKEVREADGRLRVFLQERLSSLLVVRSFSQEEQTEKDASLLMKDHKAKRMKRTVVSGAANGGFNLSMNFLYVLCVFFCGFGILEGTMSYGNLLAIMQLVGQIQNPLANLTGFLPKYYALLASAERLMEVESFSKDDEDPLPLEEAETFYREKLAAFGLEKASFSYLPPVKEEGEKEQPVVISGLDLEIKKGEFVAFVGPSGCGKSTVLKLFMTLYPLKKGLRYVAAPEKREFTGLYRNLFAYVPQGNHLLSGSIRDILSFGDEKRRMDDKGLWFALSVAVADGFVSDMEKGLDSVLGEHGVGLSEGQIQRLAIARAIFSGHPVLLLDEATSALDEATASRLLENLRAMTDRTLIMVTHRTSHMELFDRVVPFEAYGE